MPELWDYLYLHTGDILQFGRKGARLGRKVSNSKRKTLHVDDDLPGERLEIGGSAGGYRGILTMPHGARAVPVVLPIKSEDLIEGGDRPAFQSDTQKNRVAGKHELESGTILIEDSIFVLLSKFNFNTVKNIVEKAQSTRLQMYEIEFPNLVGLCSYQRANRLEIWKIRNANESISVDISGADYDEIEEVLESMIQVGPQLFDYLQPYLLDILETRLMFDSIMVLSLDDDDCLDNFLELVDRFAPLLINLEKFSGGKWQSGFIVPYTSTSGDQFRHIEKMLDRLDLGYLLPFIDASLGGRSSSLTVEDWFELLSSLGSIFPTLNDLGWTEQEEGNDLMMNKQFHDNLLSGVLINFIPFIVKKLGDPVVPPSMQRLGVQLRKGGVYHRGHRVVCDRNRRNTERDITAWLELYDRKDGRVLQQDVGNHAELTHDHAHMDYTNCKWMVIRIANSQPLPLSTHDFNKLIYPDEYHNERPDRRPNPNPLEAFVTLPWFINKDDGRGDVGIIGDDSKQLVHVHFIEQSSHGDPFVIIPLCVNSISDGLKLSGVPMKSFTTICFRTMFSPPLKGEEEEHAMDHYYHDEVPPGSAWWVERPSTVDHRPPSPGSSIRPSP